MRVRVSYHAQIRAVVGRAADDFELPAGATVRDGLDLVAQNANATDGTKLRTHLFADEHTIRPSLLVVLNNAPVPHHSASSTELHDGDAISLLPPIAGG